jgi:hypothetical protein
MEHDSSHRPRPLFRGATLALISLVALSSVSCMTTYDAYGRPVQSVDPGLAVAGVAAAGLIGYALADDDNDHRQYHTSSGGYGGSCGSSYGGYGNSYGGYGGSYGGYGNSYGGYGSSYGGYGGGYGGRCR